MLHSSSMFPDIAVCCFSDDTDGSVDYGNMHLLDSSYLAPNEKSARKSPAQSADRTPDQSPLRASALHQSAAPSAGGPLSPPIDESVCLTYSQLLLQESDVEDEEPEEPAHTASRDRDVTHAQCQLPTARGPMPITAARVR